MGTLVKYLTDTKTNRADQNTLIIKMFQIGYLIYENISSNESSRHTAETHVTSYCTENFRHFNGKRGTEGSTKDFVIPPALLANDRPSKEHFIETFVHMMVHWCDIEGRLLAKYANIAKVCTSPGKK